MTLPYLCLCSASPQHRRFAIEIVVQATVGRILHPSKGLSLQENLPLEISAPSERVGKCIESQCTGDALLFRPARVIGEVFRIGALNLVDGSSVKFNSFDIEITIMSWNGAYIHLHTPNMEFRNKVDRCLNTQHQGGYHYLWFDSMNSCYQLGDAYRIFT